MDDKTDIKSLSRDQIYAYIEKLGLPKYRGQQLITWLWDKGVDSFEDMTNLPKPLRESLSNRFVLSDSKIIDVYISVDSTRKYLIGFSDATSVEAVGIPTKRDEKLTVCFSTQAGCAMNCSFCATGRSGFKRNLTIGEMVDQVRLIGNHFKRRVNNLVAMGQGEPFCNYDAVLEALRIMNTQPHFTIGARHITVSTCGIIDGIERFSEEPEQFTLAVSLHSAIQQTRDRLMPGVRHYPLTALKEALKAYGEKTRRRPSLEYALISDVNDTDVELEALVDFCSGMLSHVNLMPLNSTGIEQATSDEMQASSRIALFKATLEKHGIAVSVRNSRGSDIAGACGQLHQHHDKDA